MIFNRLFAFIVLVVANSISYSANTTASPNLNKPTGKILFASDKLDENVKIYIMNADGTNQRLFTHTKNKRLFTHNDEYKDDLIISPNGKLIVYTSAKQLYVMNADGTGQHKIASQGEAPVWSPNSKSIAFQSYQTGNWEIYVINADGTNQRNITNSPRTETYPNWSPDGKTIAFHTTRAGKDDTYNSNWEIYKMNADGTNPVRLTTTKTLNWLPVWSPDGKTIAYWSNFNNRWNLYLMDSDGSNQRPLTYNGASGNTLTSPTWSPDGKFIAFMSSQPDGWEIREINVKERNIVKIFTNHKFNGVLQWLK